MKKKDCKIMQTMESLYGRRVQKAKYKLKELGLNFDYWATTG